VAKTIKMQLWGILNAIVLKVSNGPVVGFNRRIKMIKVRSRGFRNKARFANAIYFHPGGRDLYPEGVLGILPTRSGEEPINLIMAAAAFNFKKVDEGDYFLASKIKTVQSSNENYVYKSRYDLTDNKLSSDLN